MGLILINILFKIVMKSICCWGMKSRMNREMDAMSTKNLIIAGEKLIWDLFK